MNLPRLNRRTRCPLLAAAVVLVIYGATDRRAPAGFPGIAIALVLTLIHLVGIPVIDTFGIMGAEPVSNSPWQTGGNEGMDIHLNLARRLRATGESNFT
jgi:hypothetical protein